jgi:hypothetical protein
LGIAHMPQATVPHRAPSTTNSRRGNVCPGGCHAGASRAGGRISDEGPCVRYETHGPGNIRHSKRRRAPLRARNQLHLRQGPVQKAGALEQAGPPGLASPEGETRACPLSRACRHAAHAVPCWPAPPRDLTGGMDSRNPADREGRTTTPATASDRGTDPNFTRHWACRALPRFARLHKWSAAVRPSIAADCGVPNDGPGALSFSFTSTTEASKHWVPPLFRRACRPFWKRAVPL